MKTCEECKGKGWIEYHQVGTNHPPDTYKCWDCEDGLVFEDEQEKRLYEILMQ